MKADAFANKEWEAYWAREGPALLTSGWISAHPDIPLSTLEELGSLDFLSLSSAVKSLSLGANETAEEHTTESIVAVAGRCQEVKMATMTEKLTPQLDYEMDVSSSSPPEGVVVESESTADDKAVSSTTVVVGCPLIRGEEGSSEVTERDVSTTEAASLSPEAVTAMWNEHYNSYYWFMYQSFLEVQQCQEQQVVGEGDENESQESEAMEPNDGEVSALVYYI